MLDFISRIFFLPRGIDDNFKLKKRTVELFQQMDFFNLTLLPTGRFTGYDATVDPSVPNSLAAAAMRFGHSTIRNNFRRVAKDPQQLFPSIPVREFLNPEFVYETEFGGVDSIMRGLAIDEANEVDR